MWNGPIGGTDYSKCDFNKGPWVGGCMELTHEEVLFVWETTEQFRVQKPWDDFYIVSQYNIFVKYEKAVNGDTYNVIKTYDPEVNLLGINEFGIIKPDEAPISEEINPTVEEPTAVEGDPVVEEETPTSEV